MYVSRTATLLIFLGSKPEKYFESPNCLRELAEANRTQANRAEANWKPNRTPLIVVHDGSTKAFRKALRSASRPLGKCPEDHWRFFLEATEWPRPIIPWHRARDFQNVCLALIAERVLRSSPGYSHVSALPLGLPDDLRDRQLRLKQPAIVAYSPSNDGVRRVVDAMDKLIKLDGPSQVNWRRAHADDSDDKEGITHFLVYLNDHTFKDPNPSESQLANDLRFAIAEKIKIVLVHENDPDLGGCEFDLFFQTTPRDLIRDNLFGTLAIGWHPDEFRDISCKQLAYALGAEGNSAGCLHHCLHHCLDHCLGKQSRATRPRLSHCVPEGGAEMVPLPSAPGGPAPAGMALLRDASSPPKF